MKAELRSIIAGAACAWLLAGCGGGGSNGGNSSGNDDGDTSNTYLQVDAAILPDAALRACVNRLAEENDWQSMDDVDAIACGDVEIRSIEGLQEFPGLRQLKVAAPRLPVSEIPLLASLPLEDYERKPFYKNWDESSALNAQYALKAFLQDGKPLIAQGEAVTLMVLVSDDPAAVRPDFTWSLYLENAAANDTLATAQWEQGSIRAGLYTEIHWLKVQEAQSRAFNAFSSFDLEQEEIESISLNWLNSSALISQIEYIDSTLKACIDIAAEDNQWLYTAQVTTLNCAGQEIYSLQGIEHFKLIRRLELQNNRLSSAQGLSSLTRLEYVDLRNNPLRSKLPENLRGPSLIVLSDPAIENFNLIALSEQSCGIRIDNFDPRQQYWLVKPQMDNNHISPYSMMSGSQAERRVWSDFANGDCMSLSGLTSGAWVVIAGDEAVVEYGSRNGFMLDEHGVIQQMFFWSDLWGAGEIVLPGEPSNVFYSAQSDGEKYRLHQWHTHQWQSGWSVDTEYKPLHMADGEVFLADGDVRNRLYPKAFAKVNGEGRLITLPDRPIAGLPWRRVSVGGRLWMLGVYDDWGFNPSVMVWDAASNAWEMKAHLPVSDFNYYGFTAEGRACIRVIEQFLPSQFCWVEANSRWEEVEFTGAEGWVFSRAGQSYRLDPEYFADWTLISSLIGPLLPLEAEYYESNIYSHIVDALAPEGIFDRGNQPLLQQYDIGSGEWVPFGPPLFGFASRADSTLMDDNMLVTFPKSIVRYPITEPVTSLTGAQID